MPRAHSRTGLTLVELAVVIAIIVVLTLVLLPMSPWWSGAKVASCQGNLKQMGTIFRLYADEAPGNRLPPKSPFAAAPDVAVLYPERMYDFEPLVCPEDRDAKVIDDRWYAASGKPNIEAIRREGDASYTYLGFAVPNNAWLDPADLVSPLLETALENPDEDTHWPDHPNRNVDDVTLYRLHYGIERTLANEGHIPKFAGTEYLAIMWDNLTMHSTAAKFGNSAEIWQVLTFNHEPIACNVLFLDGHVEFVEYEAGRFPVTDELATLSHGGFRSDLPNEKL